MAAIDSLLRLMNHRAADALILESGQIPAFMRSGTLEQLSMPALEAAVVALFLSELATEEQLQDVRSGSSMELKHDSGESGHYAIDVERSRDGYKLNCRAIEPTKLGSAAKMSSLRISSRPATDRKSAGGRNLDSSVLKFVSRTMTKHPEASDLLITSGRPARAKINGRWLQLTEDVVFSSEAIDAAVAAILSDCERAQFVTGGSVDVIVDLRDECELRFRGNLFRQQRGLALALRPIRTAVPSLRQIGLPDSLAELANYSSGLVLMTGPAGSGKSTTLAALVESVNQSCCRHIITLEDPIEYEYTENLSVIHQRQLGLHVDSFAGGLRAALREAPDIILLGEMRDLDAISAALTAAETGHLVLATLHCGDAASAISRIIDVFPAHGQSQVRTQLAMVLRAVVTQRLLAACDGGRVPAYEIMTVNSAIANLIREDKAFQIPSAIMTSKADGMVPMERTLANLVRDRRVTVEAALAETNHSDSLSQLLRTVA